MKLVDSQKLILASKSPRRRDLLEQLGFEIKIHPSHIDENKIKYDRPDEYVQRLAVLKAQTTAENHPDEYIVGADTIVVIDRQILGKPKSAENAMEMLKMLNRKTHQVYTGFCIYHSEKNICIKKSVKTDVRFKSCTDRELQWYIDTREPFGKAGAYAIQGIGSFMVKSINGSYSNVVGLPVCELVQALENLNLLSF